MTALWLGLVLFMPSTARAAAAGPCIAGLPCVIGKTANDPANPNDGPNVTGPNKSKAGSSQACDADFMNQIYARAYNEAEREAVMNELVIRKPDSILEYTCYDQVVSMTARIAGPLFTESTAWQNRRVTTSAGGSAGGSSGYGFLTNPVITVTLNTYMGDAKLDASLQTLVLQTLGQYVNSNFGHPFLGGYASGNDGSISSAIGTGNYTCGFMNSVYSFAKCNNFATDDGFQTFSKLTALDPRTLPAACPQPATITEPLIGLAGNKDLTSVNFDAVSPTWRDRMIPVGCDKIDPIPTGVMTLRETKSVNLFGQVTTTNSITYAEKICPNPGCYYDQPTNRCKQAP